MSQNPDRSEAQDNAQQGQQGQKQGPASYGEAKEIDVAILREKLLGEYVGKKVDVAQRAENGLRRDGGEEDVFPCQRSGGQQPAKLHLLQEAQEEPQQQSQQKAAGSLDKEKDAEKLCEPQGDGAFAEFRYGLHRHVQIAPTAVQSQRDGQRHIIEQQRHHAGVEQQISQACQLQFGPAAGKAQSAAEKPSQFCTARKFPIRTPSAVQKAKSLAVLRMFR